MGTTCCCLGTASVYLCSCWGGPLSLVTPQSLEFSLSSCVRSTYCIVGRWEAQVGGAKLARRWCTLVCSVADSLFQELHPAAGCQTYIRFCPVSQAISSPYVTVNAYRDTAPCLSLQICAVEEEEAVCLLVMCSKLGSYFTPAGIYSHSHPQGSSWDVVLTTDLFANSLKSSPPYPSLHWIFNVANLYMDDRSCCLVAL